MAGGLCQAADAGGDGSESSRRKDTILGLLGQSSVERHVRG